MTYVNYVISNNLNFIQVYHTNYSQIRLESIFTNIKITNITTTKKDYFEI